MTGGYPGPDSFWTALSELEEGGADIIEIGAPFTDPVADGPVVAAAALAALEGGATLAGILSGLSERPAKVPRVLMSYANPLVQHAWERAPEGPPLATMAKSLKILAGELKEAGISGVIIPDTPFEEAGPFHEAFSEKGIELIPLVGPNTTKERMALYKPMAGGYVYVVSALGTTGVREDLPREAAATMARARSVFDLPVALGFGIKDPSQLAALGTEPDAVIFGSALLRHIEAGGSCSEFMAPWTGAPAA